MPGQWPGITKEDNKQMEFWESGNYGDIDFPEDLFDNANDPQDGILDMAQQQMENEGLSGLTIQQLGLGLGFAEEMTVDNEHEMQAAFDAAVNDFDDDLGDGTLVSLQTRSASTKPSSAFHQWVQDVAQGKKTVDDPL